MKHVKRIILLLAVSMVAGFCTKSHTDKKNEGERWYLVEVSAGWTGIKKGAALGYKQTLLLNPDSTFQIKRTYETTATTEEGTYHFKQYATGTAIELSYSFPIPGGVIERVPELVKKGSDTLFYDASALDGVRIIYAKSKQ